jgi:hypothetical protein
MRDALLPTWVGPRPFFFFLLAAMLLVLAAPPLSIAQVVAEPEGYRALVEEALAERGLAHYAESRALFAKAHAVYPNARTLRGLCLSEFDLRNYVESVALLNAALASSVRPLDDSLRAEVQSVRESALNYIGRFSVTLVPEHALLSVHEAPVDGAKHAQLMLAVGDHDLLAQATGCITQCRHLTVLGGEQQPVAMTLLPVAPPPAADARVQQDGVANKPWYKRGWVWGVGAVAAGAVASAVVLATRDGTTTEAPAYGGTANVVLRAP